MLPYTPIHHLLVGDVGRAIVLTSGNISDEPIAYEDDDARDRLGRIADAFLSHDRAIHIRTDDSVVRIVRDVEQPVRRSRGAVPQPLVMRRSFDSQVLAVGAELKNTFCLGKERYVFMSHHIGDLENAETLRSFVDGIDHFQHLFDVRPEVVAHDVHPEYLSTKYAMTLPIERLAVQHHHAHIASCLADNDIDGPVIGIAFDGLGYGTDETLWGGEFLIADTSSFERVGHFAAVPMPGGAVAIKEPWRMAVSYLAEAGVETHGLAVARRNASSWDKVAAVARSRYAPQTSSVGRLFDAVSAILGLRDEVDYEGHAAVELEQYADAAETGAYRVVFSGDSSFTIDGPSLVGMIADDLAAGTAGPTIAARFHNAIADVIVAASERLRETTGLDAVALSGGVFQNVLLVERSVANLEARGFSVLTHRRVPPNDGGISLGQAVVAAAR
jgi:hydrogenase maturation protein HypF